MLAAALEISPVLLIYPLGLAEATEYLPGRQAGPFDAALVERRDLRERRGRHGAGGAPASDRALP
jgi:hypothetical protein